jgi:aquaporin Z
VPIQQADGLIETVGYWVAQLSGAIVGPLLLWWMLSLTRDEATVAVSGMGIGIALALVNLIGIPFDGASANPARSFGPAVITGGAAFSQVWVFLLAPMAGAVLATLLHFVVHPLPSGLIGRRKRSEETRRQPRADAP